MAIGIGSTLNERFLLDRELGRGGMGAVYSAVDQVLQRRVAVKVLKEQSGEEVGRRLRLEAQILARLLHDNIVRLYDFGQTQGAYYLIMEEVDGSSFSKRWRSLPPVERLQVLADVAEALHYAHQQGVIHRDVKPANVLLTGPGRPKLSDFGLSMIVDHGEDEGIVRGTPHYMSPEQAKGRRIDHRSDLYSLGILLYETATGKLPFTGNPMSILSQHVGTPPDRPRVRAPGISEPLDELIVSLMSKEPDRRPISGEVVARLLRAEIERQRQGEQTETTAIGPPLVSLSPVSGRDNGPVEPEEGPIEDQQTEGARLTVPAVSTDSDSDRPLPATFPPPTVDPIMVPPAVSVQIQAEPSAAATPTSTSGTAGRISGTESRDVLDLVASPLVRKMLETVLAEPLVLSPDERYLHGHYLAYLLGGAKRGGLLLRKPLDPKNADRARLLLAMTHVTCSPDPEAAVAEAASLLDAKIEVRAALNPVVVAKYLNSRETPARRKAFRKHRAAIQAASRHAQSAMTDPKGMLNPGLMPQFLDDLRKIAPPRTEVDDVLVERWNRVVELWRDHPEFRRSVLQYTSGKSARDPAVQVLWPEVVYPLIELGRLQRRSRSNTEAAWDYLRSRIFHMPDAGVLLDRMINRVMPQRVVQQLDDSLDLIVDRLPVEDFDLDPPPRVESRRLAVGDGGEDSASMTAFRLALTEQEADTSGVIPLAAPDPIRFLQGDLHELWKEALKNLQEARSTGPGPKSPPGRQPAQVGPYRLVVIPSVRGRAAGQVAIQGMNNKQLELTTPAIRTKGSAAKPLIAIWVYADASLAITHLDFQNTERYVLWDATRNQELKLGDVGDLNHELVSRNLQPLDNISRALSRRFKPQDPM